MSEQTQLDPEDAAVLIHAGLMTMPKMPKPKANLASLVKKAVKRGYRVELDIDGDWDPGAEMQATATVMVMGDAWSAISDDPGVALAQALARAIRAREPQQVSFNTEEAA